MATAPQLGGLNDQYRYESFIYPQNLAVDGSGYPHYVIFYINQSNNTQYVTRNSSTGRPPTDLPQRQANLLADGTGSTADYQLPGRLAELSRPPTSRVSTAIVLYYPHQLEMSQSVKWTNEEMGSANALANLITNNKDQSIKDNLYDLGMSWGGAALQNAGSRADRFTNMSIKDVISKASRMAINPHLEVLFNGIDFRTFRFDYQFMPQSEEESDLVDNIIRAFRWYSAPEVDTSTRGRFFRYPAEFDIKFYSHNKENQYLNRISTCVLTDINVIYTGSSAGWVGFRPPQRADKTGSAPVKINVTLQFTETEIMTKKRIKEGF